MSHDREAVPEPSCDAFQRVLASILVAVRIIVLWSRSVSRHHQRTGPLRVVPQLSSSSIGGRYASCRDTWRDNVNTGYVQEIIS